MLKHTLLIILRSMALTIAVLYIYFFWGPFIVSFSIVLLIKIAGKNSKSKIFV